MAYGYLFYGKMRVTQTYGNNGHTGMDIVGDDSTTVHCCVAGTVETTHDWDGYSTSQSSIESYGNFVVVKASDGMRFYYAHLKSYQVKVGQSLKVGDVIGIMGATGNVTGAHTHFEARTGSSTSTRTNPAKYCCLEDKLGTYYSTDTAGSGYNTYTVVSGSKNLNYRSSPSTSATVKGTLKNGATVSVADDYQKTADGHTWFKVKINGSTYYAAAEYLQLMLDVDGCWGQLTTRRLQHYLGTTIDGTVSDQWDCYKSDNPGLTSGWDWKEKPSKCSAVLTALQKKIGLSTANQNGWIGPITVKGLQKYLGTTQDGKLSGDGKSECIKALQTALNKASF